MPHLTIEYSANIETSIDMGRLCSSLCDILASTGHFEPGGIRVRAVRCEAFAIADQAVKNAFVDMVLRIGTGRSEADKKQTGEALFAGAGEELAELLAHPHFALSLEVREIDPALSWKKNSIHVRLR